MKSSVNLPVREAGLSEDDIKVHEGYMKEALKQAKKAYANGDVPVGCVIVRDGKIIARSYNKRNKLNSSLGHAEILAIKKACKKVEDFRLDDCSMYVTLEPCQMCAGAIIQARIKEVYIGAMNPKAGCAGSIIDILHIDKFNHMPYTLTGVLEEENSKLLKDFFKAMRKGNI